MRNIILGLLLLLMSTVGWGEDFSLKCTTDDIDPLKYYRIWDFSKEEMIVRGEIFTSNGSDKTAPYYIWLWQEDRIVFGYSSTPAESISHKLSDETVLIGGNVFLPHQMQIVEWSVAARHRIFKSGIFTNDCVLLPALGS